MLADSMWADNSHVRTDCAIFKGIHIAGKTQFGGVQLQACMWAKLVQFDGVRLQAGCKQNQVQFGRLHLHACV